MGSCKIKSHHLTRHNVHFIGTGWKMKKKQGLCQFASKVPKSVRSMKSLSQKKKCACRKLRKKSGRILILKKSSLQKDSLKKLRLKSLRAKDASRKVVWKFRKKKFIHLRRSALKEVIAWKCRKKKWRQISSLKSIHGTRRLHLKENILWKRRKKKWSFYKFILGMKSSHLKKDHAWKRRKKKWSLSKGLKFAFGLK